MRNRNAVSKNVNAASSESGGETQWKTMAMEAARKYADEYAGRQKEEKQQSKIVEYFRHNKDLDEITQNEGDELSALQVRDFGERLQRREISDEDEVEMLMKLRGTVDMPGGSTWITAKVADDPWKNAAFSQIFGQGCGNNVVEEAQFIEEILSKPLGTGEDLRTPVGFQKLREMTMANLKRRADRETYERYDQAMDDLEQDLYGKRFEYYKAFENLKKRAEEQGAKRRSKEAKQNRSVETGATVTGESRSSSVPGGGLWRIAAEQGEKILNQATVDGDPWLQGGEEYMLTKESLAEAGLQPEFVVQVERQNIALSNMFKVDSGQRSAVVAYLPTDEGVKVRTYYLSRSQGVWRYMPDYVRDGKEKVDLIGKGYSEESTTLPYNVQRALGSLQMSQGEQPLKNQTNPDFYFYGAAKAYGSRQEYEQAIRSRTLRGDYYREVASVPEDSGIEILPKSEKLPPESLAVPAGDLPNYGSMRAAYQTVTSTAGLVSVEVYDSVDGRGDWLMCSDVQGRAWVGGKEVKSAITSTGLHQRWTKLGDLATPLYEYNIQTGGYGDTSDVSGSNYQCMWKNYLSRIPLIRSYVQWKRQHNTAA